MFKSSLIKMLRSLDAKEFREFGELVNSPFFNKNESSRKLYDYLKKCYPEFSPGFIEKEKVFREIFDKADYNDGFMRIVIFNLGELTEEYMRQVNIKGDNARRGLILLDELNKRKLEKEFNRNLAKAGKEIEKIKNVETEYYYYRFLYQHLMNNYVNWSRFKNKNLKDNYDAELIGENKNLSEYSIIKLMSNYRNFILKKENISVEYTSDFLDGILKYVSENPDEFKDAPSVMLHVNEVLLLKTKDEKYYRELKDFLYSGQGTRDERYSLLNILQPYCVHKGYEGQSGFLLQRFEMYKLALENNFYSGSEDIYIDAQLFPNVVRVALRLNQFEWARGFISKYSRELPPDERDVITGYLEGRVHFEKGEFDKAIKKLEGLKTTRHMQYKVIIRNLMLMLFLELGNFDKAEAFFASYRQFLSKNEKYFAPRRFMRFTDFMKYYQLLLKIKANTAQSARDENRIIELEMLQRELEGNPNMIEWEWLVKKAKELNS